MLFILSLKWAQVIPPGGRARTYAPAKIGMLLAVVGNFSCNHGIVDNPHGSAIGPGPGHRHRAFLLGFGQMTGVPNERH